MNILKPVLLSAVFSSAMLASIAAATERPPRVGEEKIVRKPAPPQAGAAAPDRKPIKRRAVRQVLGDDIRSAPPAAVYAPTLTQPAPGRPAQEMPTINGVPPVHGVPPPPVMLNCVGGACIDSSGARYNGGVGTTLIGPQGRLCVDNGLTVQCR